jgi:hypothetical protein
MTPTDATVHRLLVGALASAIAWDHGTVVQADGVGTLPKPQAIGGSRPDVLATATDGSFIIGEAKTFRSHGNAISADFTAALRGFDEWARQQDRTVRLALAVPSGVAETAHQAAHEAGWMDDLVDVIEVDV